jgi:hypothetical protein
MSEEVSKILVTSGAMEMTGVRRQVRENPDVTGQNTKWIMGMIATALVSGLLGWSGNVNKAIPDLQIAMAEMKVRQEFMVSEFGRLSRLVEGMSADHEEDRRRLAR